MSSSRKRNPAEITLPSAAHIAKYLIGELLAADKKMPMLTRMALTTAIKDGGGVDEIANILYDKGLFISIDKNNPEHQEWLQTGAAELEK